MSELELCELDALRPDEAKAYTEFVNEIVKPNFLAIEIGTWKGYSASILGKKIKETGGHLYVVDHWRGIEGWVKEAQERDIFRVFTNNMRILELEEVVHPLVMDSLTASRIFKDNFVDFIFIDACHKYEAVRDDIKNWLPKLKAGGIMAGHDYLRPENVGYGHEGVTRAVNEVFSLVNLLGNTSIWYRRLNA